MSAFTIPGAQLELAPVFLLAALVLQLGIVRAADKRRERRSLRSARADQIPFVDRSARPPG